jgi:hypothetical protein
MDAWRAAAFPDPWPAVLWNQRRLLMDQCKNPTGSLHVMGPLEPVIRKA